MSDRAPRDANKPLSVHLEPLSGSKAVIPGDRRGGGGQQLGANIVVEAANTVVIIVIAPFLGLSKLLELAPRVARSGLLGFLLIFAVAALDRAPIPPASAQMAASAEAPAPGRYQGVCDRGSSEGQAVDIEIFENAGSMRLRRSIDGGFVLYTLQSTSDGTHLFHNGKLMRQIETQADGLRLVTPTLFCSGVTVTSTQARA